MEFKDIGEFDNYIVSCTEKEKFEEIIEDELFQNNKALQINFINNPLTPDDLVNKLYKTTIFSEVKKILEKKKDIRWQEVFTIKS